MTHPDPALVPGLTGTAATLVSEALLATSMGSGTVRVFATPAMVALMEAAAVDCIARHLAPGDTSLGVHIDVRHTAGTPAGLDVSATATLTSVEGRKLTFAIEARDAREVIGTAQHTRLIVDAARFMARVESKRPAT